MQWASLHCHDHYSLLDGLSKPNQIAAKVKELDLYGCAITNHGNMSSVAQFASAMKSTKKKTIFGNEFYISAQDASIQTPTNRSCSHLVVLAKNHDGYKNLILATSESNKPEHFYYKPRLDLNKLGKIGDGKLIVFSGHPGSDLANVCFTDIKAAYSARTYADAKALVRGDWYQAVVGLAKKYMDLFGRENFYFEIQLIDKDNIPAAEIVAKILRYVGGKENIPCVATADSHYVNREDSIDQRILLCSRFQTTFAEVQKKISSDSEGESDGLIGFFRSNNYHIPSVAEIAQLHQGHEVELENSIKIADACGEFSILGKPMIPQFECPDGIEPAAYLEKLCEKGWNSIIERKINRGKHEEYKSRLDYELGVLNGAGLASYFLIVQDYINWAKRDSLVVVRGSAAGCLVSYLIGISDVDPIEFDLLFERFYNAGRNTKDNVSLPDIDTDFETSKRDQVINYIKNKYGPDRVSQIATFGRLQGKAALKDVLRAWGACSFEESNRITEHIPNDSKIADELQLMRENGVEPSIIRWALENNSKELSEWCVINDEGKLEGKFAKYFEQAMRLEGTKRQVGQHAAGIVISQKPLAEVVPLLYDKNNGSTKVGLEFTDAEKLGMVKFDILATNVLDKLSTIQKDLLIGRR